MCHFLLADLHLINWLCYFLCFSSIQKSWDYFDTVNLECYGTSSHFAATILLLIAIVCIRRAHLMCACFVALMCIVQVLVEITPGRVNKAFSTCHIFKCMQEFFSKEVLITARHWTHTHYGYVGSEWLKIWSPTFLP